MVLRTVCLNGVSWMLPISDAPTELPSNREKKKVLQVTTSDPLATDFPHLLLAMKSFMYLYTKMISATYTSQFWYSEWTSLVHDEELTSNWNCTELARKGNEMNTPLRRDSSLKLTSPEYRWLLGLADRHQSVLWSSSSHHLKNCHLMTLTVSMWLLPAKRQSKCPNFEVFKVISLRILGF